MHAISEEGAGCASARRVVLIRTLCSIAVVTGLVCSVALPMSSHNTMVMQHRRQLGIDEDACGFRDRHTWAGHALHGFAMLRPLYCAAGLLGP